MSIHVNVRVGVEWVNKFHDDSCKQNNLEYCDDQAVGFYNTMGSRGHTKVFNWGDDNAWETDFTHPNFGGDSLNWTDDVHFVFFVSHGGNNSNILSLSFAKKHNSCSSRSDKWRLGSKKLKWLVSAGCETVLNTDSAHIAAVWFGPMKGLHMMLGYIGSSHDSWWTDDLGEDFANDICDGDTIAGSWVDCAYSFWVDDDSIAIAAGETRDDAINRRDHETLDWRDLDVRATNWLAWKYKR
ncbi:MAG: hypothetical protein IPP96_15435 [Chitinophagaceae bacterium]|nr:hypothetical protein [Chitinophagaceae bacterium]